MKFIICLNSKTKSYNHVKRHRKGHWQNQTSFAMKAMEGMGMEGTYLSIIKGIFGGKKSSVILNGGKTQTFPLRSKTGQECPLYINPFSIVLKSQLEQGDK